MRSPTRRRWRSSGFSWSRTSSGRKLAAETDRLRPALLTSISHDLRTPLAAILGSASTLRDFATALDEAAKASCSGRSSMRPSGSTGSSPTSST